MPAQVQGPSQLRHPRPRSRGLGSAGGGMWTRATGSGGGARWILAGPSVEPSSQVGPCRRRPRLRALRVAPPSLGEGPPASKSTDPAPGRESAPAPGEVPLSRNQGPKLGQIPAAQLGPQWP